MPGFGPGDGGSNPPGAIILLGKFMMKQREVWDILADSWTHLRVRPEPEIIEFSKKTRGKVLDVGCGNCRNLLPFLEKKVDCFGLDYSKGMIREAKKFLKRRGLKAKLIVGNASRLPFKEKVFEKVICVRTLHHLEKREERIETLKELKRVGNEILISVWKKWQRRFIFKLLKNFFSSDVYVEWRYHGKVYKRFYHLYTKRELEKDLKEAKVKAKKIWFDRKGNIWVLA